MIFNDNKYDTSAQTFQVHFYSLNLDLISLKSVVKQMLIVLHNPMIVSAV